MGSRLPQRKRKPFNWKLMMLAIPGLLFLLLFNYLPLFGLILPFKKLDYSKGIFGSDWVGFQNFEFFFKSQDAWRITCNTLVLAVILALLQFYADFGMFYFLTRDSGTLYAVTNVIDTYVYRALRVTGNIGMSSAVGLYQSVVGFLLVLWLSARSTKTALCSKEGGNRI